MLEIRVLLEGSQVIAGIEHSWVDAEKPGAKMFKVSRAKMFKVSRMGPHDFFLNCRGQGGFFLRMEAPAAVVLPPNHATLHYNDGDDDAHGLKWLLAGSRKVLASPIEINKKAIDEHPVLQNPTYAMVLAELQKQVES